MNFELFVKSVSKIENLPLPGRQAHYKMAPIERINELQQLAKADYNPKKAAVLALFYPDKELNTSLILILRKTYQGVHSNQVGFPGGKPEKADADLTETALRETEEEIGVSRKHIKVLRMLTDIYIPPSNFVVQPFLGISQKQLSFIRQEEEVEDLIEVSLQDFLSEKSIIERKITTSYATDIMVPAFKLNGHVVWGATAMMLYEIKEILNELL
jgi:8-oxo-dGTP pyrophosphatase MutT (NUDIX family)